MKVCLLTLYPPTKHGIAEYASRLVQALSTQSPRNCKIIVLADKERNFNNEMSRDAEILIRRSWRKGVLSSFTMLNAVLHENPDIIHAHFTYTYIWGKMLLSALFTFTLLLLKILRKPVVVTIHDVISLSSLNNETVKLYGTKIHYTICRFGFLVITKMISIFSHKIVVHGAVLKKILVKEYRINPAKIAIIRLGSPWFSQANPCSIQLSQPHFNDTGSDAEGKKTLNLQGKRVILFFGFLAPNKGLQWLIRSFANVVLKDANTTLVIAGENHPRLNYDYKAELNELVSKLGLERRVLFTGYVADDVAPLLFRAADIVVLPYLSGVSASAVLKTAIGYAKPIICSDLPTFQEEITHGVNGILVRPNDDKALTQALLKLLSDDGLKEKFAKELKRTAGQQLWSSVAKDTFELYLRLSGGSQDGIA